MTQSIIETPIELVQPQANRQAHIQRRVTWLELFFDLVFVVAVSRLAATLHHDMTPPGFGNYLLLFVPVWLNWVSFTYYADLFDIPEKHDLTFKCLFLLAMLGMLVMAVTIEDALHGGSTVYALSYIFLRLLLIAAYLRSYFQIPAARDLCIRIVAGFTLAAALWVVSLFVPEPARYTVWLVALLVDSLVPIVAYLTIRSAPVQLSHMPERFGLFTLIVLGEAILAVSSGIAGVEWTPTALLIGVGGFGIAVCFWLIYFDFVDEDAVQRALTGSRRELLRGFVFAYGHFVIFAGITAAGVGIEVAIAEATHELLPAGALLALCGGTALLLLITSITQWMTGRSLHSNIPYMRVGASAIIVALGLLGGSLSPVWVVGGVLITLAALVAYELSLERQLRQMRPASAGE